MRTTRSAISALLLAGVLASAGSLVTAGPIEAAALPGAIAAGPKPVPKVVLIVGPAGAATDRYRAEARAAADVARQFTPDVTELYSPDATWPAVKAALQGASLVVYMGHGNGWPSRYHDHLYRPTEDGFGLNPASGGDDEAHQYFGEDRIAADIHLAKDAVVLFHHLCYASGLSEPGLPEGSLDEAKQRVDNYAAGFIAAGASAVLAEAYASPSRNVAAILGGKRSIDAIWRTAPNANGHAFAYDSVRSPGFVAEMDPATPTSGFERSIVLRRGLLTTDVRAGAAGSAAGGSVPPDPLLPSLVQTGIVLGTPDLTGGTLAGGGARLTIPYTIDEPRRLPAVIEASVRWDRLDPAEAGPTPSGAPPDLVAPETIGSVVAPTTLMIGKKALTVDVALPEEPGRYRLTITLHDGAGIAFDAATQAALPTLVVRVTGEVDGAIVAAPAVEATQGASTDLPIQVTNLGQAPWGSAPIPGIRGRDSGIPGVSAEVVGHRVSLASIDPATTPEAADAPSPPPDVVAFLPPGLAPGLPIALDLAIDAPAAAGDYLLVLDVVVPDHGSLAALGIAPTMVRVYLTEPLPAPAPSDGAPTLD